MIPIGRCPIRHCHRRPFSLGAGKVEHPEWGSIELDRWFTKVHIKCGRVHGCVLAHSRKEQISQRAWSSGWENNIVLDVKCNAVVFARLTKHGSIQKVGTGGRFDLCHGAFCGYRPVILHFVCGALRFHRVVSAFWGFRRWELCQFTVVVSPPLAAGRVHGVTNTMACGCRRLFSCWRVPRLVQQACDKYCHVRWRSTLAERESLSSTPIFTRVYDKVLTDIEQDGPVEVGTGDFTIRIASR